MDVLSQEQMNELREDFDFNDVNHDGRIQFQEFVALLDGLEAEVSEEEALVGFDEIDTDDDGAIGFDEFVAWWTRA